MKRKEKRKIYKKANDSYGVNRGKVEVGTQKGVLLLQENNVGRDKRGFF